MKWSNASVGMTGTSRVCVRTREGKAVRKTDSAPEEPALSLSNGAGLNFPRTLVLGTSPAILGTLLT